jgi:membrane-associated phospholipid phosphatase
VIAAPGVGRARLRRRLVVEGVLACVGLVVFVLLAEAFVGGGQVVSFDDNVSRWVAGGLPPGVEWAARLVTWLGGAIGTAVVTVTAAAVLWHARRRFDALFVGSSVVGITIAVAILKAVYERARPDAGSPIPLPHSYSFPSGHAATAVVLYGALGLLLAERARSRLRAAGWLAAAAAVALAIGWSRVLLNVHFVSDVLAGFAVGLAFVSCAAIVRDLIAARAVPPAGS